jgi:hypothetical protein
MVDTRPAPVRELSIQGLGFVDGLPAEEGAKDAVLTQHR